MSPAVSAFLLIFTLRFVSSTATTDAVPDSATCPTELVMFVYNLQSQCHPSISSNPPLQVDGNFVERALTSRRRNAYTSVFFYASWCPFSQSIRPKFESLAAMFPQIEHLAVEQSYAFPSVFSRYGVHSFPSILLVNQTMKVRYRGPKDLQSLMQFYVKTTGLEPVQHLTEAEATNLQSDGNSILQPWDGSPLEQVLRREPYLALSILFLCFRVMLFFSPKLLLHLKSFCSSNIPRLNLGMFGETSQLFERILHLVDVRRVWTKLRLCKARNFREGAKNCRVLASSFASVSLGESSSSTARS